MAKLRMLFTIIQMVITVTITIILMYLFKKSNRSIRRIWSLLQIKLMGIDLEIQGQYDQNADMMIMNHQSLVDIILLEYLATKDLAWVAKKEIADLPWFGHILKAPNMIIVERENKSSLVKLIKSAKARLDENRQLAIFPEGTRTDGKKLRKFKAGAKIVANKYNLTVQPCVIINSRYILDSKKMTQNSGKVKIIYLPTVQADKNSSWYEDVEQQMKQVLENEIKAYQK